MRYALLGGLLILTLGSAWAETVTLAETSQGKTVRHVSTVSRTQDQGLWWETTTSTEGTSRIATNAEGFPTFWEMTSPKGGVKLESDGVTLKASGTGNGKPFDGTLALQGRLWSLNFEVPLKVFARQHFSGTRPFLMVAPGKLDKSIGMVLVKDGEATFAGKPAVKVKVTLEGPMAIFWSAQILADPATGELLRYQGNKGPGTPDSVIALESVTP